VLSVALTSAMSRVAAAASFGHHADNSPALHQITRFQLPIQKVDNIVVMVANISRQGCWQAGI
jgi:hypothetical protein